jgi:hypothetical protein
MAAEADEDRVRDWRVRRWQRPDGEFVKRHPLTTVDGYVGKKLWQLREEGMEAHLPVTVVMLSDGQGLKAGEGYRDAGFLTQLPGRRCDGGLAGLALAAGQLPHSAQMYLLRPLCQEYFRVFCRRTPDRGQGDVEEQMLRSATPAWGAVTVADVVVRARKSFVFRHLRKSRANPELPD